jgi:hypothetical protein
VGVVERFHSCTNHDDAGFTLILRTISKLLCDSKSDRDPYHDDYNIHLHCSIALYCSADGFAIYRFIQPKHVSVFKLFGDAHAKYSQAR